MHRLSLNDKICCLAVLLFGFIGASGTAAGIALGRAWHLAVISRGMVDRSRGSSGEPKIIRFAKNPSPTPSFQVTDLYGKRVSTVQLKGKVVLINFWATWCPPCRAEIPDLITLQKRYPTELQIVGVSLDADATPTELKEFVDKVGVNYPIVMDNRIQDEYGGVPALPTSFLVNKDGAIVQKHVGILDLEETDTEIRYLLGMPVTAHIETFEDTGEIFLKNARRATELPGVDFSGLTPEQKAVALKRLNSENCTCGCKLTLAQCRINDSTCDHSLMLAAKIIEEVKSEAH